MKIAPKTIITESMKIETVVEDKTFLRLSVSLILLTISPVFLFVKNDSGSFRMWL